MSPNTATALGVGAIVLWATLASLTALKGPLPPFQTTAIAFTIGGALMVLIAVLRGRAALLRPTPASLALGIYGLFIYHALYFAALSLAPPAEASLIASLWALLTVLLSGLLPGHRLRLAHIAGALLGFAAAILLVHDKLVPARISAAPAPAGATCWRWAAPWYGRATRWPRGCSPPSPARAWLLPASSPPPSPACAASPSRHGPPPSVGRHGPRSPAWASARWVPPSSSGTSA